MSGNGGWRDEERFRVVVRDRSGRILRDEKAPHFAAAKPIFDEIFPADDESVSLQHGIRIMLKKGQVDPI